MFSYHFPDIPTAGGQLLAAVKMFKGKSSNWVVSSQHHSPSGDLCGVMHVKRSFIAWLLGSSAALHLVSNIVTFHTRNILD